MVFTTSQRAEIAENDPTWLLKLRIRAALTIFLFIPLGCFAYVVGTSSNFQSPAFEYDSRVWPCLLLIILSLIWNVITILVYTKWKRPLNPLIQLLIHGLLTLLFLIIGAVATHYAAVASGLAKNDPYAPAPGADPIPSMGHNVKADNGSEVLVTPNNEQSCPAFANCTAQALWMQDTEHRAGVAIAGCAIFFLIMPIHFLLTVLFVRDYRKRRLEMDRLGSDAFQTSTMADESRGLKNPYGDAVPLTKSTTQMNLLREGRGGLGFHKPNFANDSVLSIATTQGEAQPRPSTATTTRSRGRFMRTKSTGPSLPLGLSISRATSKASTIVSRRKKSNASTIASRRRKSSNVSDLPPIPAIDTSKLLRTSTSDSMNLPLTPDTAILKSPVSPLEEDYLDNFKFPAPGQQDRDIEALPKPKKAARKVEAPILKKPSPPKLSVFPAERPLSPTQAARPQTPTMAFDSLNKTANASPAKTFKSATTAPKRSMEQLASPTHDPFSAEPFDHDELSALPVIPLEALPRISKETSRPSSPLSGLGDLDMLRSIRSNLFASDADTNRSRSSYASNARSGRSSPFRSHSPISFQSANSGRQSPWRARQERRDLQKELEREREQREKELADAEQKAHRAAEKMESAYLREEIRSADDKAAMRKQTIEARIQKLKDTLDELKRVQDEEEKRAEERAEKERQEEEEFQQEMAKYGNVVAARVVEHRRQESMAKSVEAAQGSASRPTTRGVDTRPGTSSGATVGKGKGKMSIESGLTEKALPPIPPTPSEEEEGQSVMRYSWETGKTFAHTRKDTGG